MKKTTVSLLIGGFVITFFARNLANAAAKAEAIQFNNKFDFYLLATQWIPGWCEVGSGQSGASVDNLRACQQQINRPLMFHGVWPENNDGSYPSFCSLVPKLDPTQLTFANPFKNYLSNANDFLDHEWNKHGTCSNHYSSGLEHTNANEYYTQINQYFTQGLNLYQKIQIPTLDLKLKTTELQAIISKENPQIPSDAILVMCDRDHHQQQYLTGLWFCTNKAQDKFIPCPLPLQKKTCTGTLITR